MRLRMVKRPWKWIKMINWSGESSKASTPFPPFLCLGPPLSCSNWILKWCVCKSEEARRKWRMSTLQLLFVELTSTRDRPGLGRTRHCRPTVSAWAWVGHTIRLQVCPPAYEALKKYFLPFVSARGLLN